MQVVHPSRGVIDGMLGYDIAGFHTVSRFHASCLISHKSGAESGHMHPNRAFSRIISKNAEIVNGSRKNHAAGQGGNRK